MAKKITEFQVRNSLTNQKEVFKPRVKGKVGMYICGVTSYDFSHIGHARAYVAFDVLFRYLKHVGYEVVYVRNFTDVDDKIIKKANEVGEDPIALSGRFCEEFRKDMDDLQCLPPTHQQRVTDHMDQIKDMIAQVTELYHPLALRHFLLGTHYRYWVLQQLKEKALKRAELTEEEVLHSIEERRLARENKEFGRSDEIRSELAAKGIALMDVGKESIWRPCVRVQQEQEQKHVPVVKSEPSSIPTQVEPPPAEKEKLVISADQ